MTHRWTRFSTDRFAIDLLALALAGAVMLAFAAGCLQQEDPNTFHVEGRAPSTPPRVVPATYGYPPEPPVVDSLGLREFADRFRGRVVVLDFWASWCNRCRDEMPRMVEMQRQLKASGVQVISCNLDDAQSWSRQTVPYLQSVLGNFPCVVVPQSAKGPLRDWLGQNWDFGLPARFVIDERGELIGRLLENDSIEQVASAVERAAAGASTERVARRPEGALELRFRLIDVRTGQSQSVPADGENAAAIASKLAEAVARRVACRTRRIALLPIAAPGRGAAGPLGHEITSQTADELRRLGYNDLLEESAAAGDLRRRNLSVAAIEFDPKIVQGNLGADYAVLGWMSGAPGAQSASRER